MKKHARFPRQPDQRAAVLDQRRNLKMASSASAYVRGSTRRFYQWLDGKSIPAGPDIWICGDCHLGNLGPVADADGNIEIQIRDFDQAVIGNPAYDLIRLGLSLATAARGSDLPGVTTARMLEQMIEGYGAGLQGDAAAGKDNPRPQSVRVVMRKAARRSWKHLARERIEDVTPTIPLGKSFWPLTADERAALEGLFATERLRQLATALRQRDDHAAIDVLDAAYWMKGCSSLGRLRFAVLLGVGDQRAGNDNLCLMDIKQAVTSAAPGKTRAPAPKDYAERVLAAARSLSPHLGERMVATRLLGRPVFVRELLPQDLKVEIDQLSREEAMKAARFLASVVGKAHGGQMDAATRGCWQREISRSTTKQLDAPSWLWSNVVGLVARQEAAYLEHCRRYAMEEAAG
ncbi:MAG: DUF2252 family protein [Acetobacteraceae bacterium]|jgi:uncharacterized protein (DUF2252 family)